jgi:hypothetical protein
LQYLVKRFYWFLFVFMNVKWIYNLVRSCCQVLHLSGS